MIKYIVLMLFPIFVFASESAGESGGTDIIPRAINFIIFAGILYYLIAEPAKAYFSGRKSAIADKLDSIQQKLKASAKEKEDAKELVEKAKLSAQEILNLSENEIRILEDKVANDLKLELENLEKGFEDQTTIERRKMIRDVVSEVLDTMFAKDSLSVEKDELINIVMKKVA